MLQLVTCNLELIGMKSFVSARRPLINLPGNKRAVVDDVSLPPPWTEKLSSEDKRRSEAFGAGRFRDISTIYQRRGNNPRWLIVIDITSPPSHPPTPVERIDERVTGSARVSAFN